MKAPAANCGTWGWFIMARSRQLREEAFGQVSERRGTGCASEDAPAKSGSLARGEYLAAKPRPAGHLLAGDCFSDLRQNRQRGPVAPSSTFPEIELGSGGEMLPRVRRLKRHLAIDRGAPRNQWTGGK